MQVKTKFFLQRLQDRLLLDCPVPEPLRRAIFCTTSIFDQWSRPCDVANLFAHNGVPPRLPSLRREHHHHHRTLGIYTGILALIITIRFDISLLLLTFSVKI